MKIAFITEMSFHGKVNVSYRNMRTEFSWMYALDADHFNISLYEKIIDYDHVFIIFPKGEIHLNSFAVKLVEKYNPLSDLLKIPIVEKLKSNNKKVHFIQEGPHWLYNDYEIFDQINFYNLISQCDSIFAHNQHDLVYYKGLFPNKPIHLIKSLMIEDSIKDIEPIKEDKVMIGGNFARWYGGFESYIVASNFKIPVWAQDSHAKRKNEDMIEGLNHLQRLDWVDWMKTLSKFKYAVHLMPTVAAGTFSLNCAYFGIPCIGNKDVDTQRICNPELSVDVNDIETAVQLSLKLRDDKNFYEECSHKTKYNYKKFYSIETWKDNMTKILN